MPPPPWALTGPATALAAARGGREDEVAAGPVQEVGAQERGALLHLVARGGLGEEEVEVVQQQQAGRRAQPRLHEGLAGGAWPATPATPRGPGDA